MVNALALGMPGMVEWVIVAAVGVVLLAVLAALVVVVVKLATKRQ